MTTFNNGHDMTIQISIHERVIGHPLVSSKKRMQLFCAVARQRLADCTLSFGKHWNITPRLDSGEIVGARPDIDIIFPDSGNHMPEKDKAAFIEQAVDSIREARCKLTPYSCTLGVNGTICARV